MTFVPKSYEIDPKTLEELSLPLRKARFGCCFLGREGGLWSWLLHKISPWEAVLVLDESPCWHQPGINFYKAFMNAQITCNWAIYCWGYVAYIANARKDTSGTSGDSWQVQQLHSSSHTRQWVTYVEDLPLPHMHTHSYTYTHDTHACTHTHEQLGWWDFFLRSHGIQNCRLVARPLFSFLSLSVHTGKKQNLRAGLHQIFIKLKGA